MKNARVATDNAGGQLSCGGHVADGRPREAIWSGWGGGFPSWGGWGFREWEVLPASKVGSLKGQLCPCPRGPAPHPTQGQLSMVHFSPFAIG